MAVGLISLLFALMVIDVFCPRTTVSMHFNSKTDLYQCTFGLVQTCIARCLGLFNETMSACEYDRVTGEEIVHISPEDECLACPLVSKDTESGRTITATNKFMGSVTTTRLCGKNIFFSRAVSNNWDFSLHSCALNNMKPWDPVNVQEVECIVQNLPFQHRSSGKMFANGFASGCPAAASVWTNHTWCGANRAKSFLLEHWLPWAERQTREKPGPNAKQACVVLTFSGAKGSPPNNLRLDLADCARGAPFVCEADKT
ncbi:Hypothetical predicted protein [Cloeon dipterum]|uniref:C-type lectin domain-containing protein n=1 Tax=Cloeon dipterum TaxID=197152 RepID=A0A8S1DJM7_9INSE|nr:Hypothetical predicted protein [Cloeon dipterum]